MVTHLRRLKEVMHVLSKYGLASVLGEYGFAWYLPFFKRFTKEMPKDVPKRLCQALEELGGAFVKLGQMLSLRPDLIPKEFCHEFAKLLDQVPAESLRNIEVSIEHEFKKPAKVLFKHIDPRPLGSASIAQVHKARLTDGKAVAVKVQRPHIAQQFTEDISLLYFIAQKVQKHITNIKPVLIVQEFERYTKRELNFMTEGQNIEDMQKGKPKNIVIPKVFWSHTTEKILTMEYLDGKKVSELKLPQVHLAQSLVDAFLEQVFRAGVFHADLHGGNILLLSHDKIGLLDFGIVGHIDDRTKRLGFELYQAILAGKSLAITEVLLEYGVPSKSTDVLEFTSHVDQLMQDWFLGEKRVTHLMHQLFLLCAEHKIALPYDTMLLGKGMITVEATARQLDPDFNFVRQSQKILHELLREKKEPKALLNSFMVQSTKFVRDLAMLPGKALATLEGIEHGKVQISLKDDQFRHLGEDINRSSNRLSYALVSAALILAASVLLDTGPEVYGYSIISAASLSIAAIFLFALLGSIAGERFDLH